MAIFVLCTHCTSVVPALYVSCLVFFVHGWDDVRCFFLGRRVCKL